MLNTVNDALVWIAAVGGVLATIGTWFGPLRARWQLRAEALRNSKDRRENQVHRQRFAEIWEWQRSQPEGPERMEAARWFSEWTGAARPRRGGLDSGPMTPGLHSGNGDEAYERYVDFLSAASESRQLASAVQPQSSGQSLELPSARGVFRRFRRPRVAG